MKKEYGFYLPIVIFELCCYAILSPGIFSAFFTGDGQSMDEASFHRFVAAVVLLLLFMLISIGMALVRSGSVPDEYVIRGAIILKLTMAPIFILLWIMILAGIVLAFTMIFIPLSIFMILTALVCSILLQIPGIIYSYVVCSRMRKKYGWSRKRAVLHRFLLSCWVLDVIDICYLGIKVWNQKKIVGGCLVFLLFLVAVTTCSSILGTIVQI